MVLVVECSLGVRCHGRRGCIGIFLSFGAGVCGHWQSREELIQLLVYIDEESFYGHDHALGGLGCIIDHLVLICKKPDICQGMQGVCLLVFICIVGSYQSGQDSLGSCLWVVIVGLTDWMFDLEVWV